MRIPRISFLFLVIFSLCSVASAWPGKVLNVFGGDTLALLGGHQEGVTVLLYGIDCPNLGQDFSNEATDFVLKQTDGVEITCEDKIVDERSTHTCMVYLPDGSCLNEKLIAAGLAWVKPDCADDSWRSLQAKAKAAHIGLWSKSSPVAPWEFHPVVAP